MNHKKRTRYLSRRAVALFIGGAGILLLTLVACLYCMLTGAQTIWPLVLALLLLLSLVILSWFGVARPYHERERAVHLLLDGHHLPEEGGAPGVFLSPADEEMFHQVWELFNPSHLFNLNKRQAQYMALQNQINPHFLYNTLESIRSETMSAHLDSVADMTEALASFFRYTISKVENLVSVEEELQNCETYFRIQQYRFGDRLVLRVECDEEDREEIYRCRLPKLSMQPILENCIIHGTELKIGTGHLTIHLERTGKRLLIRISDDGVGMDERTLGALNERLGKSGLTVHHQDPEQKGGLALVNVNNRIQLLFGEEYGLHVFSLLDMGTDVEFTLPVITSDRDVTNREALQ